MLSKTVHLQTHKRNQQLAHLFLKMLQAYLKWYTTKIYKKITWFLIRAIAQDR